MRIAGLLVYRKVYQMPLLATLCWNPLALSHIWSKTSLCLSWAVLPLLLLEAS